MAIYTEELNTTLNYANINIYNQYKDGVQYGYKVKPSDSCVMYDVNDEYYVQDSPDSEPVLTRRYWIIAYLPLNYDFSDFPYAAVLRQALRDKINETEAE